MFFIERILGRNYYAVWLTIIVLYSTNVGAAGLSILKDSILSDMDGKDIKSLKTEIGLALANAPDKTYVTWESKDGKIQVEIVSKLTYNINETLCRKMSFHFGGASNRPEKYTFDLCNKNGKWEITSSLIRELAESDKDFLKHHIASALESAESNTPHSWHNQQTSRTGIIVSSAPFLIDTVTCRDLAVTVVDKDGNTGEGSYRYCKLKGKWKRAAIITK